MVKPSMKAQKPRAINPPTLSCTAFALRRNGRMRLVFPFLLLNIVFPFVLPLLALLYYGLFVNRP